MFTNIRASDGNDHRGLEINRSVGALLDLASQLQVNKLPVGYDMTDNGSDDLSLCRVYPNSEDCVG
jgi:hypothetical protein